MADKLQAIYSCEGDIATKHLTIDESHTLCGVQTVVTEGDTKLYFDHELDHETACEKCKQMSLSNK
ncbi:MAG: hypothetical protein H0U59_07685 [Gemmatimonadaceae bacterium]|nr:hypothetical protein [Gemmatimonadaceae bacterium]